MLVVPTIGAVTPVSDTTVKFRTKQSTDHPTFFRETPRDRNLSHANIHFLGDILDTEAFAPMNNTQSK